MEQILWFLPELYATLASWTETKAGMSVHNRIWDENGQREPVIPSGSFLVSSLVTLVGPHVSSQ